MNRPTVERVREVFSLSEDGDLLLWKKPTSNRAKVGQPAGAGSGARRFVAVDGWKGSASALKHLFVHGVWPDGFVDAESGAVFAQRTRGAALTLERLRQVLDYDAATGAFTWKERTSKCTRIGASAGSNTASGYLRIFIFGREYLAHRLAWMYVHGEMPRSLIDHINGVRTDNRIANLRDASRAVNQQNQRRAMVTNHLGVLGVRQRTTNSFSATLVIDGKPKHLGSFKTAELAHAAYVEAKRRHHAGCTL